MWEVVVSSCHWRSKGADRPKRQSGGGGKIGMIMTETGMITAKMVVLTAKRGDNNNIILLAKEIYM